MQYVLHYGFFYYHTIVRKVKITKACQISTGVFTVSKDCPYSVVVDRRVCSTVFFTWFADKLVY